MDNLYGGAIVSLADYVSSFHIIFSDKNFWDSVSLNLNTNFKRPIFLNDKIDIHSKMLKNGKNVSDC